MKNFITINFYKNWENSIYSITKKEEKILNEGIKFYYDESTSIKELFLFLNKQFEDLHCNQNQIAYRKLNENGMLKYLYRLVVKERLIFISDLNIKLRKLIKIINLNEITILLTVFVGIGGVVLRTNGMRFYMHSKENGKHNLPHIHVSYNGQEASISLDGNVLDGYLAQKKLRCAKKVIEENKESLLLKWNDLTDGQKFEFKNNELLRIF